MLIALINDTHFGHHSASDVFLDYTERFFSEVFFPYCRSRGIKHVLHLGDLFDNRKVINVQALHRARKFFIERLRDEGMTMDLILGNHDCLSKSTNRVNSPKELLGYFINSVTIVEHPTQLEYEGCKIGLVPWICPENHDRSMSFIEKSKCEVLLGHFEMKGFEMQLGVKSDFGLDPKMFERFPLVLSGHFHTRSQYNNIRYLGTQFEMTWADCADDKYFHVLDTETLELVPVRNPITIYKKVVYDDSERDWSREDVSDCKGHYVKMIVAKKNDPDMLVLAVDKMITAGALDVKVSETHEEFVGENVLQTADAAQNTPSLIDGYVDSAETHLDRTMLKGLMRELYAEAQEKETEE